MQFGDGDRAEDQDRRVQVWGRARDEEGGRRGRWEGCEWDWGLPMILILTDAASA